MGQGGCGGERNPQAAGAERGDAEVTRADGELDCPGGQRYLSNAVRRKRFTRTDATFDNAWGSADVRIGGDAAVGETVRFGGQSGGMGFVPGNDDEENLREIHEEASSRVEYLGKTVWR